MRSLLFVPGSRPDRIDKALSSGADAVCVDLEDAVPPADKAAARDAAFERLGATSDFGVRINAPRTQEGPADLEALAGHAPAFVMVPKAESADDIAQVRAVYAGAIIALIESAEGVRCAWDVAAADGVSAVMFGGGDYSAELGAELAFEPMLFARSAIIAAAARAGVPAIDVPYLDVKNEAGLISDTRRVKALGYTARACIHPAQIAGVNGVFTPSDLEIKHANAVLRALEAAGGAAALLNGKLIEKPVALAAERVIAAARAAGRA